MAAVDIIDQLLSRFWSFDRLKRCVAWLLRYSAYIWIKSKKKAVFELSCLKGCLRADELQVAAKKIVKLLQGKEFKEEIRVAWLNSNFDEVPRRQKNKIKSSRLNKLAPVNIDGILRVRGRLRGRCLILI